MLSLISVYVIPFCFPVLSIALLLFHISHSPLPCMMSPWLPTPAAHYHLISSPVCISPRVFTFKLSRIIPRLRTLPVWLPCLCTTNPACLSQLQITCLPLIRIVCLPVCLVGLDLSACPTWDISLPAQYLYLIAWFMFLPVNRLQTKWLFVLLLCPLCCGFESSRYSTIWTLCPSRLCGMERGFGFSRAALGIPWRDAEGLLDQMVHISTQLTATCHDQTRESDTAASTSPAVPITPAILTILVWQLNWLILPSTY